MMVDKYIPEDFLRESLPIPNTSESDAVRRFVNLSRKNHSIDSGFYPLGSCTMKYNPKINENIARIGGFANTHPLTEEKYTQGNLKVMYELSEMLCEITGMDSFTLQPAAGAHGELAGLMMIRAYHESIGQGERDTMIIPDSAHGTNPASAVMAGYKVHEIKSDEMGNIDIEELKRAVNERTAGLMLTNPSTLGLFEVNITEIADIVHDAGGLLYYDGANLNAIMGVTRPGDMGFDVIHLNLHKTFSTPHGGGGPGSGPVGVKSFLKNFLPVPTVVKSDDGYRLDYDLPDSIGKVRSFYGNFGVFLKAYAYILSMGADGLKYASETAVLNANYLMHKMKEYLEVPYDRTCMHEFVASGESLKKFGVTTMDVAKRMTDFGVHPPTVYFPLIVKDAMMFEPTETESKESLDVFAKTVADIIAEAETSPYILKTAPHNTPIGRLDEVKAARQLILKAEVKP